ncbi:MAG: cyclodeaminase/cyclohydrolase family protein [Phycisphaerae bacterium]|nr:cyclodeaminase/cyclohydrolase family protein [Phycisphaerae bacterium]
MVPDIGQMTVRDFCTALSAKTPTPGGGAVAGVTAAHAASLVAMVVEYSRGKASFAAVEPEVDSLLQSLRTQIDASLAAARADAEAYSELNALWRKPADDPERVAHWAQAVTGAITAPQLIVRLAADLSERCRSLAGQTAKHLDSDLAIAADLAGCAARAAAWNVRVNLPSLDDPDHRIAVQRDLDELLAIVRDNVHSTNRLLEARG